MAGWSRIRSLCCKLQALVYDILPLEKGAGERCSECAYVAVDRFHTALFSALEQTHCMRFYKMSEHGD